MVVHIKLDSLLSTDLMKLADEKSVSLLEEFAKDPEPIVSQSCEVALSMLEFEKSGKSFEVSNIFPDFNSEEPMESF